MSTLHDLLKRINIEKDSDKMFVLRDKNGGWTNVHFEVRDNEITIRKDIGEPWSDER